MENNNITIGFDRFVMLEWLNSAQYMYRDSNSEIQLRELISKHIKGTESQRKTIDIINRLTIKPFPTITNHIRRGNDLINQNEVNFLLPAMWGCAISSYPFFGKIVESLGRLFSIQGDCTVNEIKRRMAEFFGDRDGVSRAVSRVLQSLEDWKVIQRNISENRINKTPIVYIENEELTIWLIESLIRFKSKPVDIASIYSHPALFPFLLTQPLNYIISKSSYLKTYSDGPSNQVATIL